MIVAGLGFRDSASEASLTDALSRVGGAPQALATAQAKADHPALRALADRLGLTVIAIPPEVLTAQRTQTRSTASLEAYGTGSVAEAAALAAAGEGALLLTARVISADQMATCALATKAQS